MFVKSICCAGNDRSLILRSGIQMARAQRWIRRGAQTNGLSFIELNPFHPRPSEVKSSDRFSDVLSHDIGLEHTCEARVNELDILSSVQLPSKSTRVVCSVRVRCRRPGNDIEEFCDVVERLDVQRATGRRDAATRGRDGFQSRFDA